MKRQTTIDNILYYQENTQDILNLSLKFTHEEIGYYLIFKAAYFLYKGKIPTSKLFNYCRVFDNQELFKKFIDSNFQIKEHFYFCTSFDTEIKFIEEKSQKKRDAVNSRYQSTDVDTKVDSDVVTDEPTNDVTNINIKVNIKDKEEDKEKNIKKENQQFEIFWEKYDYKKSKPKALASFEKALKSDSLENIFAGLESYILARGTDKQYWKHPTTWLNAEAWKDEYKDAPKSNTNEILCEKINVLMSDSLVTKIDVSASNKAVLYFNTEEDYNKLTKLDKSLRDQIKDLITKELGTSGFDMKWE